MSVRWGDELSDIDLRLSDEATHALVAGESLLRRIFAGSSSAYQKRAGALLVLAVAILLSVRTQTRNHDYRSRLVIWTKNIESGPGSESLVAHNNLGIALLAQGQAAKAITHFRQAISIDPDYVYAHNNLGNALSAQGKTAEAIVHYRHAIKIRPDFAFTHNNLGNAFSAQGQPAEAIASFRLAIRIDSDYAIAHNNLGIELFPLGQTAEAITHFRRAISINPDYKDARDNLGIAQQSE